ncbi:MAG TPA: cell division protein ZapA [Polyangiaceae bacterium]|nr:cell division protein ZapA [Polyangiaceae bacterium]
MDRRTVELRIAGQKYRVVSSASEEELQRLAGVVTSKMGELSPFARAQPSQAILLAAMALAHEAEAERDRRVALEQKTRELLRRVLGRIDQALALEEVAAHHELAPELSLEHAAASGDDSDIASDAFRAKGSGEP